MSNLIVTNVNGEVVYDPSSDLGRAKGYSVIDGRDTFALLDSYNVSSIVDNGVSLYTTNLTNAMANIHYPITITGDWPTSMYAAAGSVTSAGGNTVSTTSFQCRWVEVSNGATYDINRATSVVDGALA
ncbi:hypothetical protein MTBPR1_100045 [Candidatus Terasakiella magnetica]|uniref:Uncharacterized protein n=1 Tax=Candidatus Terasakiella magnetica TaxID=1867952 RepID=A0A1C3RDW5_9PROT|nr:hypothetical protein [Candidatus Terasakiella magnetica]SCA55404.1 hypothetical protein MTBPR1_100045 [Candidatus Terasakiella magnetica]